MPHLTSIEKDDFGLVSSIGYRYLFKKYIVLIQLQDNFGFKNINKDNPYGLEERNHSMAVVISYQLRL